MPDKINEPFNDIPAVKASSTFLFISSTAEMNMRLINGESSLESFKWDMNVWSLLLSQVI